MSIRAQEKSLSHLKALVGLEYNFYPAGHILAVNFEKPINQSRHALNFRAGINLTKRKDFSGLNDNEQGWGPGLSIGYRYYQHPNCHGLLAGLKLDIWQMNINWSDSSETPSTGTTAITVLQPTFEIGYMFRLNSHWQLSTSFVNGFEINAVMDGEPVGEGWITLWHLRLARTLYAKN